MNDICKVWSSPWRALQRDLASGMCLDETAHTVSTVRTVNLQNTTVPANSWLGRARLRRVTTQARQ
jgi:hypothetical protein